MHCCMRVGGKGTLIYLSIQAVVTSIPKKRFSAAKRERVFPIGSKAHCKNAYGFGAETTVEIKCKKGFKINLTGRPSPTNPKATSGK